MDITDPVAIRFIREVVRPLCEAQRALDARYAALQTEWFAGMNTTIGSGSGFVKEDRQAEGVANLTQDQVTNAVANMLAILAAASPEVLSVPCVRPLQAT